MKEYDVTITERLQKTVTVRAENRAEAEEMLYDQWSDSMHILDADNFVDVTMNTVAEREIALTLLLVEALKPPTEIQIPDTLQALQEAVGGHIETLPMDEDTIIICNEEGKLKGLPLNRGIYSSDGELQDAIAGSFLVAGIGEEDFVSLTPDQMDKYKEKFKTPEKFQTLAGRLVAQKVVPIKQDLAGRESSR